MNPNTSLIIFMLCGVAVSVPFAVAEIRGALQRHTRPLILFAVCDALLGTCICLGALVASLPAVGLPQCLLYVGLAMIAGVIVLAKVSDMKNGPKEPVKKHKDFSNEVLNEL